MRSDESDRVSVGGGPGAQAAVSPPAGTQRSAAAGGATGGVGAWGGGVSVRLRGGAGGGKGQVLLPDFRGQGQRLTKAQSGGGQRGGRPGLVGQLLRPQRPGGAGTGVRELRGRRARQ